ncbi:hypothetical protein AVEN_87616-1 [Araneus ventricosus]|uniref:Uncharacterized protein n=1 Tax=Araneus ventricosus TaxID=182803 RepID=A0A4Y2NUJ6_ARAVE|nr:hypothetical protein AVEN_87616-1 [Araneus ventricosus]
MRASTGSGDPEVPELPSASGYILASELRQSSTFGAPVFDHRSCPSSPSTSDSCLGGFLLMSTSKVTRLQMHLLKQVLMMLQCLSPTWSCSLELKAGIKLSGSFHRSITGIRVLDQATVYQLTAAYATKQLLLASLMGISEV